MEHKLPKPVLTPYIGAALRADFSSRNLRDAVMFFRAVSERAISTEPSAMD